jgi:2'-5' RNA ligase
MSKNMRLFVAIELPSEVQTSLSSIREIAERHLRNPRWIEAKNLHLTLQFLGNCPVGQVTDISKQLELAVKGASPFTFRFESLGGFPSGNRSKVFWAGAGAGKEKIVGLQRAVGAALSPLGFEVEKRAFHPHITIARFKKPESLQSVLEAVSIRDISSEQVSVDSIVLFESRLYPRGAQYTPVEKIFLK